MNALLVLTGAAIVVLGTFAMLYDYPQFRLLEEQQKIDNDIPGQTQTVQSDIYFRIKLEFFMAVAMVITGSFIILLGLKHEIISIFKRV